MSVTTPLDEIENTVIDWAETLADDLTLDVNGNPIKVFIGGYSQEREYPYCVIIPTEQPMFGRPERAVSDVLNDSSEIIGKKHSTQQASKLSMIINFYEKSLVQDDRKRVANRSTGFKHAQKFANLCWQDITDEKLRPYLKFSKVSQPSANVITDGPDTIQTGSIVVDLNLLQTFEIVHSDFFTDVQEPTYIFNGI